MSKMTRAHGCCCLRYPEFCLLKICFTATPAAKCCYIWVIVRWKGARTVWNCRENVRWVLLPSHPDFFRENEHNNKNDGDARLLHVLLLYSVFASEFKRHKKYCNISQEEKREGFHTGRQESTASLNMNLNACLLNLCFRIVWHSGGS